MLLFSDSIYKLSRYFSSWFHDSSQKEYVIDALNAKKHVLANDPTSVILSDFMEELECAKKNGKFIQTTCMFVHQYRVQRFLNHVLQDDNFGRITEVDASIQLNYDDVEKVGVKLPLREEDGCIRVIGRFCVLVSTMFFNRVGSYAKSVKVKSSTCGPSGEIVSADCTVNFTNVSTVALQRKFHWRQCKTSLTQYFFNSNQNRIEN